MEQVETENETGETRERHIHRVVAEERYQPQPTRSSRRASECSPGRRSRTRSVGRSATRSGATDGPAGRPHRPRLPSGSCASSGVGIHRRKGRAKRPCIKIMLRPRVHGGAARAVPSRHSLWRGVLGEMQRRGRWFSQQVRGVTLVKRWVTECPGIADSARAPTAVVGFSNASATAPLSPHHLAARDKAMPRFHVQAECQRHRYWRLVLPSSLDERTGTHAQTHAWPACCWVVCRDRPSCVGDNR